MSFNFPWPKIRAPRFWWNQTWYAPCNDVTTAGAEFVWAQVPKGTNDRLQSVAVQPAKVGNAMRVEVRNGDFAWNPWAKNGQGDTIKGGWRAEVVGPTEHQTDKPVRYRWSTMIDLTHVVDPLIDDAADPNKGKPTWQVIFQWHQGETDRGSVPPVAFIILGDNIMLDVHRHDPANELNSLHVGQWPVATPLGRGTWHDFEVEILWRETKGWIKVWHNGVPVQFQPQVPAEFPTAAPYPAQPTDTLTGLGTLFPAQSAKPPPAPPPPPPSVYLKAGIYRKAVNTKPAGPFLLYHDEFYRYEQGFLIKWPPWAELRGIPTAAARQLRRLPIRR